MSRVRAVYVDLDATLLGPGGVLLRGADGAFSLEGVRALQACDRAGAEVVLMSGRRKAQVMEDARLIGQGSYIFEAGSCLVLDGEEHWLTGELMPGEAGTIHDQIEAMGAPALLLEHYADRLEYHDPWHRNREVSHLFRGLVDAAEADALLAEHGHGALRLVDNGGVHRRAPPAGAAGGGPPLPPPPGRGVKGGRRRPPHARPRPRPAGRDRGRRLARGSRDRGAR